MFEIKKKGLILARYIPNSPVKKGLSFFSKDNEFIQLGTWNYGKGKKLLAHYHNQVKRSISHTQEIILVKGGKLRTSIFDLNNKKVKDIILKKGDILILLNGGHGYEILAKNTYVIEIKNGPYLGPNIDRTRIE